ncbi:MAG: hypothetical protein CME70_08870 [Halobacteriovorax sp.]|nr:hypothetical protein [Halobacteriovorax sp.]|tara:strand:- start:71351 stop:71710 length:360 start_codon:yes stop_codon:yes gene_type:complete
MDRGEFYNLKKTIQNEGMAPIRIVSDSMEPLLDVNRNYQVASMNREPKRFDIIVFYREQKLFAHYVWRANTLGGKSFTTRSLKDPKNDEVPVPEEDILGILVGKRLNFIKKLILSLKYA